MTHSPEYLHLLDRWQKRVWSPPTLEDVVQVLKSEYNAYDIPLNSITRADYTNDGEVREQFVSRLLTITHPMSLSQIYDDEARDMQAFTADELDGEWRSLFSSVDSDTPLAYSLLLVQHRLGQRTSVLLESESGLATSFKVYGHSQPLIDRLLALVGIPNAVDQRYGIRYGDLEDEDFVWYLEKLDALGAL